MQHFKSNTIYTNRYGRRYTITGIDGGEYLFIEIDKGYGGRMLGHEGAPGVDSSDLYAFDPDGGPFMSLDCTIDEKPIKYIYIDHHDLYVMGTELTV